MSKQINIFTIEKVKALSCSANGNPKRWLLLRDKDGYLYEAKTKTDAACGYFLDYYCEGNKYLFVYHTTKNDSIIIDYVYKNDELLYKMFECAGWRERYALQNGKQQLLNNNLIKFTYSTKLTYQDAHGATYSIKAGAWIN